MKFELNYVDGRIGDQSESRKAKKVKLCHRVSDRQGASDQSYRGDRFRFFRGTSKFLAYRRLNMSEIDVFMKFF